MNFGNGRSKLAWFGTFLELPNGMPSHDTFRRMFIDPDAFEGGFTAWVGSLVAGFEREVVAIDGKTLRRSFDHGREQSLLLVWCKKGGFCTMPKHNVAAQVPRFGAQVGENFGACSRLCTCFEEKSGPNRTAAPILEGYLGSYTILYKPCGDPFMGVQHPHC